jgi:hypothetical protein
MAREPTENDLLVEFERQQIPEPFRAHYLTKRHNFLATIQQFPYIWNCFMRLDAILQREFEVMQRLRDPHLMLPMILFMNAHQKMRVASELGCSTCLTEAHSVLRDAIESTAHAHRLALNPPLQEVWIGKNDSEDAKKTFNEEFQAYKATRLFDALPDLYKLWGEFSEFGSHTNINSIQARFASVRTTEDLQFHLNYLGAEPKVLVPALFEMVLVFSELEKVLFKVAQKRLHLDNELVDMRTRFDKEKEATRQLVIKTFNLQPPSAP